MENMQHNWIYKDTQLIELPVEAGLVGFIYIITNLVDGRQYIGKKKSHFKKTRVKTVTLKNLTKKKKKISEMVESDWKTYYGSSDELKKDVDTLGQENFTREILRWCYSLSELTYFEAKYQFETDCLLKPDKYYNKWIAARCRSDHLLKTK